MKKLFALLLVLVMVTSLIACGKEDAPTPSTAPTPTQSEGNTDATPTPTTAPKGNLNVAVLKGPTAINMMKIMADDKAGTSAIDYNFTVAGAADEITASIIKGDIPVAAVPCNLAATLYNKTEGGISMLAINNLGVLYILETGDTVNSIEDLRGKTIYSTGAGTTPEYTLRHLLTSAGIDPDKDVTITYLSEASEVAARLAESDGNMVAMLPQPYVTTVLNTNPEARIALDINEEWKAFNDSEVVTGVIIVNNDFLAENGALVEQFLTEYAASSKYVVENVAEAAAWCEEFDIVKAAVATKAIPYCNLVCYTGEQMKTSAQAFLQILFDANPKSIGGKLPADDFYYGVK